MTTPLDPFALDRRSIRAAFDRAGPSYDAAAVLQTRVRAELLSRLDLVRMEPAVVLDLGTGTGQGAQALKRRYRSATVFALDAASGMLRQARRRSGWLRPLHLVCADALRLPFADGSVDLIFSSLMLQWCDDLDTVLREMRRVLAPGGFAALATLGPDTLKELRAAWAAADTGADAATGAAARRSDAHVLGFRDMHDIGDALGRSGFLEPVLDVEHLTLTYQGVRDLTADLKSLGAHNAAAARPRGLTGKNRWRAMTAAYEEFRRDGRLPASYEVVYGAAWAGEPRHAASVVDGEVRVPIGSIRRASR